MEENFMATIDLIVLGILKKESMSAYDIQKMVEYRNISKWVKISTPSIYKKVIQLEGKGYITSTQVKDGKMPEKAVYTLTDSGNSQFEKLMLDISCKPIHIFLDFNAVIVNLDSLSKDNQKILPTTNYRPALISRGLSHSCPHLILPRVCH